MRQPLLFIVVLLASGCARASDADMNAVHVSLTSARAVGCETFCTSVLVEIVIKNSGTEPICFSSRYLASALGAVTIFETGKTDTDGFLTNFPRLEEFPDNPDRPGPFVETLRAEPNVYVGAGRELRFEATAFDSYRIPQHRRLTATLGMYLYPCEGEGYRHFTSSVRLQTGEN